MSKSGYHFHDGKTKLKKGDLLLIPFGEKTPSVYQVQSTRGNKLIAVVLEDTYAKGPTAKGTLLDLTKAIYDGYWCYRHIPQVKPTKKLAKAQV